MNGLKLAWIQVRRDLRGAEAQIIVLALTLAVAAVVAVGALNDRVSAAIQAEANQLIAADAIVRGSSAIPADLVEQAQQLGLRSAQSVSLPTIVFDQEDESQLVMLKAVSEGYPLLGELRLKSSESEPAYIAQGIPQRGQVWIAPEIANNLKAQVGDALLVGALSLKVGALIDFEPDRAGGVMGLSPRVMINEGDLPASALVVPGSRVWYALMLAGEGIQAFDSWLKASSHHGSFRLLDVRAARPESQSALDRLGTFFSLTSMITVVVAGAAMLIAAQDFVRRQSSAVAVYRAMGAQRDTIAKVNLFWLSCLALIGFVLGSALGWALQAISAKWLAGAFSVPLAPAPLSGLWRALLTSVLTTVGFAYAPLMALTRVSVMSVLRVGQQDLSSTRRLTVLMVNLCFGLLVCVISRDWKMGLAMVLGLWVTVVLVYVLVLMVARMARNMGNNLQPGIRYGLGSFARRGALSAVQATALALGVLVLSTLQLIVSDLLDTWGQELPADAPNVFLINIQPQQSEALSALIDQYSPNKSELYPVVRGRLSAINGDTSVESSEVRTESGDGRQRREWNLTYRVTPRADNPTVAGQWWQPEQANSEALISVEADLAKDFGIELGDSMTFRIAGESVSAKVVHLREVKWQSLKANFFVIATPFTFQKQPYTFMTGAYIPTDQQNSFRKSLKDYPGLSAIDVQSLMSRVRGLLGQASLAVRVVFSFAVVSGLLVLWAAVHATRSARAREVAILRVMGANSASIKRSLWSEYAVLGAVSGFVGLGIAQLTASALGVMAFDIHVVPKAGTWLLTLITTTLVTALAGAFALRKVMNTPPNRVMRAD